MFFRKKKKEDPAEQRRFYRRMQGKKHALSILLQTTDGVPVAGDLLDISAGGVAVTFAKDLDPNLDTGESLTLTFGAMVHGGRVVAKAKVLSISANKNGTVYHLEFSDAHELFAQLDAFYLKFFNRRRLHRVRPALDTRLAGELHFGMGKMAIKINDISLDGFGVRLSEANGSMLTDVDSMEVVFKLHGAPSPIQWNARTVHLTTLVHGVGYGAVFTPVESQVLAEQRRELQTYTENRLADMLRWDKAEE